MADAATDRPLNQLLSIRQNQVFNLLDRSPVATAICNAEGFVLRIANPAFCALVGDGRDRLRRRPMLDIVSPVDTSSVDKLTHALNRGSRTRYPLDVCWTANGSAHAGHLTVELVDEALLGKLPLLVFLHAEHKGPAPDPALDLDPVACRILTLVAGGATTTVIARAIGLTVDGVNYHLRQLFRQLDAPNRTALVARAYFLGLLDARTWPPAATSDDVTPTRVLRTTMSPGSGTA
jgi:DNA-binding CsgD family transcriptional regulator